VRFNRTLLVWLIAMILAVALFSVMAAEPTTPSTQPTPTADPNSPLKTQEDKVSYSIGVDMANVLKKQKIEVNTDLLILGIKDVLSGGKLLMTDEEMKSTMNAFVMELRKKQAEAAQKAAEDNKKAGDEFLAKNKTAEGVVTLPSGLQYKVLTAGKGKKPTASSLVECNYKGTLLDGTEFDSSYKRGQPATFPVTGVIPGWTEALQLMPIGSKWQLFIPSNLAYGPQGTPGGPIGPNQVLIFEI
jgi:FKBP-type peptidyl-prolyl cis-trans isomerase